MKRKIISGKTVLTVLCTAIMLAGIVLSIGFRPAGDDYFFKINKSIDIFGRVYREVALNYVDVVDPERFMEAGIDGMLGTLDPYTNFISEREADEVELITAGKYGGIGVTIGVRDGFITIISLIDGYSAQRQGLQPGDRIVEIDGKTLTGVKPDEIRAMTRGEPGTELHLTIQREGESKPLQFTVIREEIQLKNLTYSAFVDSGIAYMRLERFARGAGDDLRLAIKELQLRSPIRGMILDLRDNPGGLLDVAVDVVEKFVPKGSLVVSTKGRTPESERKYYTTEEPVLPNVPLVVLINRGSASASEIVAGAIQDLDRGVILGTRSFGKGLVQTITPLSYNTQLKITTAKYYTPSGRCIQEIDYAKKGSDGVFAITPDSLKKEFKTLHGRPVFEAGGITPDTSVLLPDHSGVYGDLLRKSEFFKFATRYASSHGSLPEGVDSLLDPFKKFLGDDHYVYEDAGVSKLEDLTKIAVSSKYSPAVRDEIERLKSDITKEKASSLDRHREEVLAGIRVELMAHWKGNEGRIQSSLTDDEQANAAVDLIRHTRTFERLLRQK
ncbi:MAG TPA: S41 family peptidase [Bacteroidota bacterium]|nr:S41 family peptidase [Bacteroidota bacterium]